MNGFLQTLKVQRWDDHRFYHQSLINQSLHFVSACSFLVAYALLFTDPASAALVAWGIAMVTRQSGHFFFEPRGFDHVNNCSDEYKEAVKVGYNMRRKGVLLTVWALVPVVLWLQPSLFGLIQPGVGLHGYLHDVGIAWLSLGLTGIGFRVMQLWITKDLFTGVVWFTKILTDPVHDLMLYHNAPLQLLRGKRVAAH